MPDRRPAASPSVAVIIPAYTLDRWPLLRKTVEASRAQTVAVDEVVVCIDHNDVLLERAQAEWAGTEAPPVRVIPNRHDEHLAGRDRHERAHGASRRFGAGSARNAAAEHVQAEFIAILDDDAWPEPDWLERLLAVYEEGIVAVGGPPLPDYETERPAWFPRNFDWVFGCVYDGLPVKAAPQRRLIGANLSVRRSAFAALGGFHDVDFDDLDLCSRLAARFGQQALYYTPDAIVHHHVPAERVSWRYFWRRCFFVNREKVTAFRSMGSAANMTAERDFVRRALFVCGAREIRRGLRGEPAAFAQLGAMMAGIALAGLGHVVGRAEAFARERSGRPWQRADVG